MFFLLPFLWQSFFASVPTPVHFVPTPVDSVRTPVDSVWSPADKLTPETTAIIMASDDGGTIWHDLSNELPSTDGLMMIETLGDQIYFGIDGSLYSSSVMSTMNWKKEKFSPGVVLGLFTGKKGLYAITLQNGLFQQNEDGKWDPLYQNISDQKVFAALETTDEGLVASTDSGIYKTSDHGQTWRHVLISRSITSLTKNNNAYVVSTENGVWRSIDEGEHWTHVLITPTYATRISTFHNGFIAIVMGQEFGGIRTPNEVYTSNDLGKTWKRMLVPAELNDVFEVEQAGTVLMASGQQGIFRSSDQGKTWKFVHEGPVNKNKYYRLVSSGNTIFALRIQGC